MLWPVADPDTLSVRYDFWYVPESDKVYSQLFTDNSRLAWLPFNQTGYWEVQATIFNGVDDIFTPDPYKVCIHFCNSINVYRWFT